jgi:hypothetical protein
MGLLVEPGQAPIGDDKTYNILGFFSIVGNLWDSNCATDILIVLSLA